MDEGVLAIPWRRMTHSFLWLIVIRSAVAGMFRNETVKTKIVTIYRFNMDVLPPEGKILRRGGAGSM
jgi:hypothetical protein